jgi:hypothetical protein
MSVSRVLSPVASLAGIDHLLGIDALARAFRGFWRRMHGPTCKLAAVALKYVEWSPDGAAPNRLVWEVCEWPRGHSATWTFVCWLIDGQGMWLRPFASKEDALRFFEQSPDVVMRPRDGVADDVAEGARQRRAS